MSQPATSVFDVKVKVPRHGGDDRPKILLPEHAPNELLAGRLLRKEDVPKGTAAYYTRATTFAKAIDDTTTLTKWKLRQTAIGLSKRRDLVALVASHQDDNATVQDACDKAMEAAAASSGANEGTSLHKLSEHHDRGERVDYDDPIAKADIAAYAKATSRLTMLGIEEFVVVDALHVGGTFDRLVEFKGQRYIADLKTGTIAWSLQSIAVQLALYAHGERYDPLTGARTPLDVNQEWGIIIHLPRGEARCELVGVNIAAGWEAAQLAKAVRDWRYRKDLSRVIA